MRLRRTWLAASPSKQTVMLSTDPSAGGDSRLAETSGEHTGPRIGLARPADATDTFWLAISVEHMRLR